MLWPLRTFSLCSLQLYIYCNTALLWIVCSILYVFILQHQVSGGSRIWQAGAVWVATAEHGGQLHVARYVVVSMGARHSIRRHKTPMWSRHCIKWWWYTFDGLSDAGYHHSLCAYVRSLCLCVFKVNNWKCLGVWFLHHRCSAACQIDSKDCNCDAGFCGKICNACHFAFWKCNLQQVSILWNGKVYFYNRVFLRVNLIL